ncbi:MAG TPA: ATP-dependent DNA ligase [Geobacterales bacterium]|nr:ATP-dependent DNA ligase [Geobacterales bacterium]
MTLFYSEIVEVYEEISSTTKRLEITDTLVKLLKKASPEEVNMVVYLTQGKLYPDYLGIELGVADKFMARAIALASGVSTDKILDQYKKKGDLGVVAQEVISSKKQAGLFEFTQATSDQLTVEEVYKTLDKVARITGEGSQDSKVRLLAGLLKKATPLEAKYITRTVLGTLRLGLADMTILDAISIAYLGDKDLRPIAERAYNVSGDLGYVAKIALEKGLNGLKEVKIKLGIPIRPMLAERATSEKEIFERLDNSFVVEYKYDGERVQIHKDGKKFTLFSRSLENITHHYPDVIQHLTDNINAETAILEGEIVAIQPSGEMLPFQELMHRRRKYDIEKAIEEYPAAVFLFDLLYLNGEELIDYPLKRRRELLEQIVKTDFWIRLSEKRFADTPEKLLEILNEAVSAGCEGLMCKSLANDSVYQAGARGFLWIKLKRSYQSKMVEPIDVCIVGGFYGTGKRAGKLGGLLVAVYDPKSDTFKTICKLGTGFTDEDLDNLPKILEPYRIEHIHPRVVSKIDADVWYIPAKVIEIIGDEITLSPIHTAAFGAITKDAGLAVRFPRFTGRYRDDKKPEDATTEDEIVEMYKSQLKKVESE